MSTTKQNYRIRVTDVSGNRTYITRENGKVSYFSGSLTPLSLSNLAGGEAAELQFNLSDLTSIGAVAAVRKFCVKAEFV